MKNKEITQDPDVKVQKKYIKNIRKIVPEKTDVSTAEPDYAGMMHTCDSSVI